MLIHIQRHQTWHNLHVMSLSPTKFLFTTMINFCKKSVHSLFNIITSTISQRDSISAYHRRNTMRSGGAGLSILINRDVVPKPNNVIQSSSLMIIKSSRKIKEAAIAPKMRGVGRGDADGLASCTESLGFESCNDKIMSNEFDQYMIDNYEKTRVKKKSKNGDKRKEKMERRMKQFPPPLKYSMNENGKPVFVLKPVRKDGRLELTGVQIHRKESLRAFRENGRLILRLVGSKEDNTKVVEQQCNKFPENCSGGEDCRWSNEMVVSHGHHHQHDHHNMHGWGQQSVIIR